MNSRLNEHRREQRARNNLAARIIAALENKGFSLQRCDVVNGHDFLTFEVVPGSVIEINVFFEPDAFRHSYYWMESDSDNSIHWEGLDEEEFEKDLDDLLSLYA